MFNTLRLCERGTLKKMAGSETIDGIGREKDSFDSRKIIESLWVFFSLRRFQHVTSDWKK